MKLNKKLLSMLLVAMAALSLCQSAFAAGSGSVILPAPTASSDQEFQSPYVVLRGTILKATIAAA